MESKVKGKSCKLPGDRFCGPTRCVPIDRTETNSEREERHRLLRFFARQKIECATPTAAVPGSEEKIKIMADRYAAGLPIFHPDDTQRPGQFTTAGFLAGLNTDPADQQSDGEDEDPLDEFDFDVGGEG